MVWSLNKDDDGLEPVVPLRQQSESHELRPGTAASHAQTNPSQHNASVPAGPYSETRERKARTASTVVVDPHSQIPPRMRRDVSGAPRTGEATRILSARKVDELRAEVLRQHRARERQKWMRFFAWAGAGAIAVAVGGWAARGLRTRSNVTVQSGAVLDPSPAPVEAQLARPAISDADGQADHADPVPSRPSEELEVAEAPAPVEASELPVLAPEPEPVPLPAPSAAPPVRSRPPSPKKARSLAELAAEEEDDGSVVIQSAR